jgi:hypothetical protein
MGDISEEVESEGRQMKSSVEFSYIKKEKIPKNPSFKENSC